MNGSHRQRLFLLLILAVWGFGLLRVIHSWSHVRSHEDPFQEIERYLPLRPLLEGYKDVPFVSAAEVPRLAKLQLFSAQYVVSPTVLHPRRSDSSKLGRLARELVRAQVLVCRCPRPYVTELAEAAQDVAAREGRQLDIERLGRRLFVIRLR